jgi:hypothetical protein
VVDALLEGFGGFFTALRIVRVRSEVQIVGIVSVFTVIDDEALWLW